MKKSFFKKIEVFHKNQIILQANQLGIFFPKFKFTNFFSNFELLQNSISRYKNSNI